MTPRVVRLFAAQAATMATGIILGMSKADAASHAVVPACRTAAIVPALKPRSTWMSKQKHRPFDLAGHLREGKPDVLENHLAVVLIAAECISCAVDNEQPGLEIARRFENFVLATGEFSRCAKSFKADEGTYPHHFPLGRSGCDKSSIK